MRRERRDGLASPMVELVRSALTGDGAGWKVWLNGMWCCARPPAHALREQGWKLHLAATRSSATAVLQRSLDVLARHRCAFKFAHSLEQVSLLTSRQYPRAGAGKFLTVYPDDDQQLVRLAEELHQATEGLSGPAILSDRRYRPGSLVHYRYGAFTGRLQLSNDGDYRTVLAGPDGTLVEDRRDAWFGAPAWARPPLPAPPQAQATGNGGAGARGAGGQAPPVLLGGRFVVRQAIRHSNRGGVFRAVDSATGAEVVVKQARPHVEADEAGRDARDGLRHEAGMLDRLAPLGVAPRRLDLFEQDGHLFLAEELLPGVPLRRWVSERAGDAPGLPWPLALGLARQLTDLVATVHRAGVVLRDLTPSNLMAAPGGELGLVDLELAAEPGAAAVVAGTRGYVAPERLRGDPPSTAADLYSLGAVVFLLATASDPGFLEDRPPWRSTAHRAAAWLAAVAGESAAARLLGPLVLGLLDQTPARRWDLDRTCAFLAGLEGPPPAPPPGPAADRRRATDGLDRLIATMDPASGERLWPSTCFGAGTDPCNLQHGAAGVIGVLARAARLGLVPGERLGGALRDACAWVERRLAREPRVLPGLHFGRSGTVWALYEAAGALADEGLATRALALCGELPVTWPNPDVTHGAAGAGLTHLHLWQASGDAGLGRRLLECADGLVASATRGATATDRGVLWTVPDSFDSRFAGTTHYGFAHGLAGIAWFLLAAGLATGRRDCAELAAVAVRRARWQCSPAACHGLAGNGEFLLDLAVTLEEPRYRTWAEEQAAAILAQHAVHDGRMVVPDDTGACVAADYGGGLAGVLAFLLRLRHGGPRLWMADVPAGAGAGARR